MSLDVAEKPPSFRLAPHQVEQLAHPGDGQCQRNLAVVREELVQFLRRDGITAPSAGEPPYKHGEVCGRDDRGILPLGRLHLRPPYEQAPGQEDGEKDRTRPDLHPGHIPRIGGGDRRVELQRAAPQRATFSARPGGGCTQIGGRARPAQAAADCHLIARVKTFTKRGLKRWGADGAHGGAAEGAARAPKVGAEAAQGGALDAAAECVAADTFGG